MINNCEYSNQSIKCKNKSEYKYKVKVSNLGVLYCDTEVEVWKFINKGSFGSLYTVRNPKDNSLYSEMIPF